MKHTPWFEGEIKPQRVGVYRHRRKAHEHVTNRTPKTVQRFNLWDGQAWRTEARSIEDRLQGRDISAYQDVEWQGLTEEEAAEEARLRAEASCLS